MPAVEITPFIAGFVKCYVDLNLDDEEFKATMYKLFPRFGYNPSQCLKLYRLTVALRAEIKAEKQKRI